MNYHPEIITTAGKINISTRAVLSYKLGHAGSWTTNPDACIRDSFIAPYRGGNLMRNTILNENPILWRLGEPERIRYRHD